MKTLLASLIALVALAWGWAFVQAPAPANVHALWLARQELLYLSGLLSVAMMSLAMFLATRPVWLEAPLGGMDRIYRSHKWAGILAVGFAALHWLIEMSDDILKATDWPPGPRSRGNSHRLAWKCCVTWPKTWANGPSTRCWPCW